MSTSFQVKTDIDIGKFSGTEPTPSDELNFDQWCIDIKSYQSSYPDNILLPAVRKSIVSKAKSIIWHLGPTYTVEEVISVLTQEYEGVASSDMIFKEFYQLRQERNEKVQVFSIRLRDALTRLSLRFPDRAPKEDQNKTLKDRFFYGICPDLRNSIRHLYDDETVTFSQLLVKAHWNEEEEMTSKLVNKGSVMGNTLEEGVDQLIAKSNQELPSNQRGNLSGHSADRAAYVCDPQPERNGNPNFQKPLDDVRQNLRGPGPNAAGPFDRSDGSRPIQCFRCRGWGHPKRLCPSWLNYTSGGSDMGASLLGRGQATRESSSKKPISSVTDMHISQEGQRYHNPDPLFGLIGPANEPTIIIEGQQFLALIDSGAQLSTMSKSLVQALKLPICRLNTLIEPEVSGGRRGVIPYTRYVEA